MSKVNTAKIFSAFIAAQGAYNNRNGNNEKLEPLKKDRIAPVDQSNSERISSKSETPPSSTVQAVSHGLTKMFTDANNDLKESSPKMDPG